MWCVVLLSFLHQMWKKSDLQLNLNQGVDRGVITLPSHVSVQRVLKRIGSSKNLILVTLLLEAKNWTVLVHWRRGWTWVAALMLRQLAELLAFVMFGETCSLRGVWELFHFRSDCGTESAEEYLSSVFRLRLIDEQINVCSVWNENWIIYLCLFWIKTCKLWTNSDENFWLV